MNDMNDNARVVVINLLSLKTVKSLPCITTKNNVKTRSVCHYDCHSDLLQNDIIVESNQGKSENFSAPYTSSNLSEHNTINVPNHLNANQSLYFGKKSGISM